MMENTEIIKALRCCASPDTPCKGLCSYHGVESCLSKKDLDAADALEAAEQRIAELESQMPKECEWIGVEYDGYADGFPVYDVWECSGCGEEHNGEEDTLPNYCPNCGAKMRGEHDEQADS